MAIIVFCIKKLIMDKASEKCTAQLIIWFSFFVLSQTRCVIVVVGIKIQYISENNNLLRNSCLNELKYSILDIRQQFLSNYIQHLYEVLLHLVATMPSCDTN